MTLSEMRETVKENLKLTDDTRDLDISDVIFNVCDYCNLNQNELPELLEPYIRKKVKGIINYETVKGTGYQLPALKRAMEALPMSQGAVTAGRAYMV